MTLEEVKAKFAADKKDSFLVVEDPESHTQTQGQTLQVDFVASALDLRNAKEGIAGTMLERLKVALVDKQQQVVSETGPATAAQPTNATETLEEPLDAVQATPDHAGNHPCDYEMDRAATIRRNQGVMQPLGLASLSPTITPLKNAKKRKSIPTKLQPPRRSTRARTSRKPGAGGDSQSEQLPLAPPSQPMEAALTQPAYNQQERSP